MRILSTILVLAAMAQAALADTYWPGPDDIVTPHATGLHLTSADGTLREGLPFGTPFHTTMHTLVAIFGHDLTVAFPQECGAGPLVSVHVPGRINLVFQEDQLAGWMMIGDSSLRTGSGLGIGSPRAALATEGAVEFYDGSIGTEFGAGDLFGLLSEDGARVLGIWSGATCIFR
ncbi:hypothetical protein [Gymnodinialimonas sp.]